jgi:HEAT repeat protein
VTGTALRIVVCLMGVYAIVIAGLFGAAFLRGRRWQKKARLTAELLPKIRSALVDYLSGNDDLAPLRRFLTISRSDVTSAMLAFQDAVAGSARDRLCALALRLELLDEWRRAIRSRDVTERRAAYAGIAFACAYEPCRHAAGDILVDALEDPDPEVRVCAAKALARFGAPAEVELVFRMAIRGDLMTRILVSGPLRSHALELSRSAVMEALHSDNAAQIVATLEMVVAWERALPLDGLAEMMRHRAPAIRIQALRAAPLAPASRENELAVMQLLADPDAEVAMAAASAAGRLRILAALPLLAQCCRSGNAALARTAAAAMTALPPQGWKTLEELATGEDVAAGAAAAEALAHVSAASGA